jgi:tetratricopeptide (TPR) repeat protein
VPGFLFFVLDSQRKLVKNFGVPATSSLLSLRLPAIILTLMLCAPAVQARQQGKPSYYDQAIQEYRQKNYPAALSAAKRALQQNPKNPASHHIYGLALAALEQFGEAEKALQQAIAIKPGEANYHYDYGYVLYQQKKYDDALPPLKRAVELDGENVMARYLLGKSYVLCADSLRIPDFSRLAFEQFTFIASRKPHFPTVHLHLGIIYANAGDQEKALAEFAKELESFPKSVQAHLEMGEILLKRGDTDKAVEHLIEAAAGAPAMPAVHYQLAMAYRKQARNEDAVKAAQRCVELDPNHAEAHYLLGQIYRQTGQPDLARQEMKLFQELKKNETPAADPGHP